MNRPVRKRAGLSLRGLAAVVTVAGVSAALPASATELETGRRLAEEMCAACHAIGQSGESANAEAPPFREIAGRYSVWNLQEVLAEGIMVGHEDMPQFTFTPGEINALLSYMDTLTPKGAQQ